MGAQEEEDDEEKSFVPVEGLLSAFVVEVGCELGTGLAFSCSQPV